MGKLIQITGIDSSGKETQAKMLSDYLKKKGQTMLMSFPDYTTNIGKEIKEMLQQPKIKHHLLQGLMTVNRQEKQTEIIQLLRSGYNVVCDRYIVDCLVYGEVSGVNYNWLFDINSHFVQPDISILVNITVDESFKRRPKREDSYEKDYHFLNEVRSKYLDHFRNLHNGYILNGMQPPLQIHKEIIRLIED